MKKHRKWWRLGCFFFFLHNHIKLLGPLLCISLEAKRNPFFFHSFRIFQYSAIPPALVSGFAYQNNMHVWSSRRWRCGFCADILHCASPLKKKKGKVKKRKTTLYFKVTCQKKGIHQCFFSNSCRRHHTPHSGADLHKCITKRRWLHLKIVKTRNLESTPIYKFPSYGVVHPKVVKGHRNRCRLIPKLSPWFFRRIFFSKLCFSKKPEEDQLPLYIWIYIFEIIRFFVFRKENRFFQNLFYVRKGWGTVLHRSTMCFCA